MNKHYKKTVLISGATGGIGSAVAQTFLDNGYQAILLYHAAPKDVITTLQARLGPDAHFIQCNLENAQEVDAAVQEGVTICGSIDVCVHSATRKIVRKRLEAMTADEFISQFDVDVFGGFNLCKSVIPIMKKGEGGTLIAITSSVIESSGAQMGAYTSAKFAVQGMLREFARELAADSIRVYAVAPGLLKTELTADLPERYFEFVEKQRGTHLETTEEVARLCMELSEGKSETGTSHSVNGGIGIPL